MVVKDAAIIQLVERIGEHYRTNISNSYIRPALHNAFIEKQTWDFVETLTKKTEEYETQVFHLDELYLQIIAAAKFVVVIRRDVLPGLRNRIPNVTDGSDKVFRQMAINNFNSNIKVFADLINELYVSLVEMDKANVKGRHPLYPTISGLEDVSRLLAGS